jgi:hypothetical protein
VLLTELEQNTFQMNLHLLMESQHTKILDTSMDLRILLDLTLLELLYVGLFKYSYNPRAFLVQETVS